MKNEVSQQIRQKKKDALTALHEDGVVTPDNCLTDKDIETLLQKLKHYTKGAAADPADANTIISHTIINFTNARNLNETLAADLKKHFTALQVGTDLTTDKNTVINYMLKAAGQHYKLKISLTYDNAVGRYDTNLSLHSIVTGQAFAQNLWTTQIHQAIAVAIKKANTQPAAAAAAGVAPATLLTLGRTTASNAREDRQKAGTSSHYTPLVMMEDWKRELGKAPLGGPYDNEDELDKLRLQAIADLADKEHKDKLFF